MCFCSVLDVFVPRTRGDSRPPPRQKKPQASQSQPAESRSGSCTVRSGKSTYPSRSIAKAQLQVDRLQPEHYCTLHNIGRLAALLDGSVSLWTTTGPSGRGSPRRTGSHGAGLVHSSYKHREPGLGTFCVFHYPQTAASPPPLAKEFWRSGNPANTRMLLLK